MEQLLDSVLDAFDEAMAPTPMIAVTCQIEKCLEPEDIAQYLDEHGQLKTTTKAVEKDLKVLRAKHHSVARLLAEGVPEGVVAEITNYTPAYISVLKNSPAMQELIANYRAPGNLAAKHIGESLRRLGDMAREELEKKVEAGAASVTELTQIAKLGFDRSGHGPQSTLHAVAEHHIIDHAEIEARRAAARQRDTGRIIPPEEARRALPAPGGTDDR